MSDEASKLIVAYIVFLIIRFVLKPDPIPQHDSIRTGDMHCRELVVASENDNRWRIASRMSRDCFFKFMDALTSARANPAVEDSENLTGVEQVLIFMTILTGIPMRKVADEWQHSTSVIRLIRILRV